MLPPPNDGWVLLWCARYSADLVSHAPTAYKTFLWNPDNPNRVLNIVLPSNVAPPASADLFCGSNCLTADGDPIVFGGTDLVTNPTLFPYGHKRVWIFQNANGLEQWVLNGVDMQRERWYATSILLPDGRILVGGHIGYPDYANPPTAFTREHGTPVVTLGTPSLVWDPSSGTKNFRNWLKQLQSAPPADCTKVETPYAGVAFIPDYARLHVMRGGQVLCEAAPFGMQSDVRPAYLVFDACPGDRGGEFERWVAALGPGPYLPRVAGASSAQLVDASGVTTHETFYSAGGGSDPSGCPNYATNQVLVMNDPDPLLPAQWSAGPSMLFARDSFTLVIGADGSTVALGGTDPGCAPVYTAERLRPPLIFSTGNTTTWLSLCDLAYARSYHSWALTLPDGRMVAGGGTISPCPTPPCQSPSNLSLEIFQPPYLFLGARPVITNWPDPPPSKQVSSPLTFEVELPGTLAPEFRVALFQPGAVTHSVHFNQRYVVLQHLPIDLQPPPALTQITANIPDANATPPGWYLLTVVSSQGVPSVGRWLKITP